MQKLPLPISCRCICLSEVLHKSKYHYLVPALHNPECPQVPGICKLFFLQVYNCSVVEQGNCDIYKLALWPKPVYKYLVPAQNRLPNALVEKVKGGLNNVRVRKTN